MIEYELNYLYQTDWEKYNKRVTQLKNMGYKILRNPQGNHRISYKPDFKEMFGGIFDKIFQTK